MIRSRIASRWLRTGILAWVAAGTLIAGSCALLQPVDDTTPGDPGMGTADGSGGVPTDGDSAQTKPSGSESADPQATPQDEATAADQQETGLTVQLLQSGQQSAVRSPVATTIGDVANWEQVWAVIHANEVNPPPVPDVDFSTHQVVILILGDRSTGGYSVRVAKVSERDRAIEVMVAVTAPNPGDMVTQVHTSPFTTVAIPDPGKPVVFVGDDVRTGFVSD